MNSNNPFTNNLFNSLSSVYQNDDGMQNSNFWTFLNAYGTMFADIQRIITNIQNNTYIASADASTLAGNFGTLVNFPPPPRLNNLSNGDDIYRAILRALYQNYFLAPTTFSIQNAVAIILSFLINDPTTTPYFQETDQIVLSLPNTTIQLPYNAVHVSGNTITGPALPSDFTISPNNFIVTGYNNTTNLLTIAQNPNSPPTSPQNYKITYYKDDTALQGTNWINTSGTGITNVLPSNLNTSVGTFDNYQFSYWWNTYNQNGQGVQVIEDLLTNDDQGIVWRLPEKFITYLNPYNPIGDIFSQTSIELDNASGQPYNINIVNDQNPETLISAIPLNYFSEVGSNVSNFYIRYSANNGPSITYAQFFGSFSGFNKTNYSLSFGSINYGTLDFFEMGENFNPNDLFSYNTKNIWLNVPFNNGSYILNNSNFYTRPISFHKSIIYQDNFLNGNLNKWFLNPSSGATIGEAILSSDFQQENCIKLISYASGTTSMASAIFPSGIVYSGNHIEMGIMDIFNSGTSSYIDVIRSSGQSYSQLRFGIDPDIQNFSSGSTIGFVQTYFSSSGNTNLAINFNYVSSGTNAPYNLVSGNTNIGSSNFSFQAATILSTSITPNLNNTTANNANLAEVNLNYSGGSVILNFDFIQYFGAIDVSGPGPNPPNIQNTYAPFNISLTINNANPFISYDITSFSYDPVNHYLYQNVGLVGYTPIPASGVNYNIEVSKGNNFKVNGVTYTGIYDPSIAWGSNLMGTGPLNSGLITAFNIGDPNSFSIVQNYSSGTATTISKYFFGNKELYKIAEINQNSGEASLQLPYYYQLTNSPNTIGYAQKNYISNFPRQKAWHTFSCDFGTDYTGNFNYSGISAQLDGYEFLDISSIGFSVPLNSLILNHNTIYPSSEFSYFNNAEVSYYDYNNLLPMYQVETNPSNDFPGAMLDQSTAIEARTFSNENVPNYHFLVEVLGWTPDIVFVVQKIVAQLKPAYTYSSVLFLVDQGLDTSSQNSTFSNPATNWESGNITNNITIAISGSSEIIVSGTGVELDQYLSLPGFIKVPPQ